MYILKKYILYMESNFHKDRVSGKMEGRESLRAGS